MNRRECVTTLGVAGGAIVSGGMPGLSALVSAAQAQTVAPGQAIPREAKDLHARTIAELPTAAQQWIHDKATYLARTPGAEDRPAFQGDLSQFTQRYPGHDVMTTMFLVFKEAVDQARADKVYFLARLAEMNDVSRAMGDYLKYLSDSLPRTNGKKDSDPVCTECRVEVQRAMATLQGLQRRLPSGPTAVVREPTTVGELKAAITRTSADLRGRDLSLRRSIAETSTRAEVAQARYGDLFPKMMSSMGRIARIR